MLNDIQADAEHAAGIERDFTQLAVLLATQPTVAATLHSIVGSAVAMTSGAEQAGLTVRRGPTWFTLAATGPLARQMDKLHSEFVEGPSQDSLLFSHALSVDHLGTDPRWPVFGPGACRQTGVNSVVAHQLVLDADVGSVAVLNLYSRQPAAFAGLDRGMLDGLITHSAIGLAKAEAKQHSQELRNALESNRRIGTAIGILMALHNVSERQGFDLLRTCSQHRHRKLREIAEDVIETGTLTL
ncbi:GAF and ANTAR domain-containing protein [Jatrophihabitans telluris]|uniref:GAF and ANTAR domain-containing protein n=1 Tax=Jatrophihabitans telluris TaxID=2038343 RepID=A0ABY4QWQ3_9ACTN|nr:GAF and ANTAR domain-containing protein [Jatrophihabitans telluris]UQX87390.1 GAF and ANTAR domain-containing protein [Jatrophihabitans telluris]